MEFPFKVFYYPSIFFKEILFLFFSSILFCTVWRYYFLTFIIKWLKIRGEKKEFHIFVGTTNISSFTSISIPNPIIYILFMSLKVTTSSALHNQAQELAMLMRNTYVYMTEQTFHQVFVHVCMLLSTCRYNE